uniref:Uncharacterized protein n=1 Tax=Peromyscus maniculatus bairdii TaxID=230844 RepID=A0A8C8TD46_PERMB
NAIFYVHSRTTMWRLMSVIFGIKCLLLMVTLGILMKNSFTMQSIQPTLSPTSTVEFQEGRFHFFPTNFD